LNRKPDQAQLRISLNRQQLARCGLSVDDIQRLIELALSRSVRRAT